MCLSPGQEQRIHKLLDQRISQLTAEKQNEIPEFIVKLKHKIDRLDNILEKKIVQDKDINCKKSPPKRSEDKEILNLVTNDIQKDHRFHNQLFCKYREIQGQLKKSERIRKRQRKFIEQMKTSKKPQKSSRRRLSM